MQGCEVLLPTSCCCFLTITGAACFSVSVVTSLLSAAVGGDDGAAVPFWSGCLSVRFSVVHTLHCGPVRFWGGGCNSSPAAAAQNPQFLIGDQAKN